MHFDMEVEDTLEIEGKGLLCTGRCVYPDPLLGVKVIILRQERVSLSEVCAGVERFAVKYKPGDTHHAGVLFKSLKTGDVNIGDRMLFLTSLL